MKDVTSRFEELRTTMFGGYKKEDVMEYIDFILSETEGIKALAMKEKKENEERLKIYEKEKKELEYKVEQLAGKAKNENGDNEFEEKFIRERERVRVLSEQNESMARRLENLNKKAEEAERTEIEIKSLEEEKNLLKEELEALKKREEEREKYYGELKEKVEVYEERSSAVFEVLTDARIKADNVLEEAHDKAADLLEQTQKDIYLQKKAVDKVICKEIEEQIESFILAKAKINEYLDKVSAIQNGLEQVYSSMNRVADEIPMSVEQLKAMEEKFIVDDEMLLEGAGNLK